MSHSIYVHPKTSKNLLSMLFKACVRKEISLIYILSFEFSQVDKSVQMCLDSNACISELDNNG